MLFDPALRALSSLLIAGLAVGAGAPILVRRRGPIHAPKREIGFAALLVVLFFLSDWALLRALPWLRLSFSTAIDLPLSASLMVRLALFWSAVVALVLFSRRMPYAATKPRQYSVIAAFVAINLGFSLIQMDAYVVEPLLVDVTTVSIQSPDLEAEAPPVRVVQLSDLHIERNSYREASVIRQVNALNPDIVVLTGDYVNLSNMHDPESAAGFREFARQIRAPHGIYATRGTVEPTPDVMARLVEGTNVVWLEQEVATVNVRGQRVTIVGIASSYDVHDDTARLAQALHDIPEHAFALLLYHTPDLIHEAAQHEVDLYLAGHTHGGQIRLPVLGALVTFSRYGRRYASGQFSEGSTNMYVSRGIGFEGGGMPRARFLCRPEIVSINLQGKRLPS